MAPPSSSGRALPASAGSGKNLKSKISIRTTTAAKYPQSVDDFSDIEIVEPPVRSPAKKSSKSRLPAPGSVAYQAMPPVSASNIISSIMHAAYASNPHTFGSSGEEEVISDWELPSPRISATAATRKSRARGEVTDAAEAVEVTPQASLSKTKKRFRSPSVSPLAPAPIIASPKAIRPKRVIKPTAKMQYVDPETTTSPPRKKIARAKKVKPSITDMSEDEAPVCDNIAPEHYSVDDGDLPTCLSYPEDVPTSDEDLPASITVESAMAIGVTRKNVAKSVAYIRSTPPAAPEARIKVEEESYSNQANDVSGVDVTLDVLHQEPAFTLGGLYVGLPVITKAASVFPFGANMSQDIPEMAFTLFDTMKKKLTKYDQEHSLQGLTFTACYPYANAARIELSLLFSARKVKPRGIRFASTKHIAYLVMTGAVMECNIVSVGESGPKGGEYPVHSIRIAPFKQEWIRECAVWGNILEFNSINAPITEFGAQFSTKKPDHAPPKKKILSALASPSKIKVPGSVKAEPWQFSRDFSAQVPIYDGRLSSEQPFHFTDDDFNALPAWPQWEGDLPTDSMVSVGYTTNTYVGSSEKLSLSLNLQFVILLALPKKASTIVEEEEADDNDS